jgi:hypothetical protein
MTIKQSDNQAGENNGRRTGSEVRTEETRRDVIMAGTDKVDKAEKFYLVGARQGG